MLTESIVGLLTGGLATLTNAGVELVKQRQANAHELALFEAQAKLAAAEHTFQLEQASAQADVEQMKQVYSFMAAPTGTWVDAFASTVRPVITYGFFMAYVGMKIAALIVASRSGFNLQNTMLYVWTPDDQMLLSAIMSFWFGSRQLSRAAAVRGAGK